MNVVGWALDPTEIQWEDRGEPIRTTGDQGAITTVRKIAIGGARVPVLAAMRFLLRTYNSDTVLLYDYGGDETATTVAPSPGPISLSDLGRVVCIGGRLNYERGHLLALQGARLSFPALTTAGLEDIPASPDVFIEHPDVCLLSELFASLTQHSGLSWGTVGKVLHLKYPSHLPIPDRHFVDAYRSTAVGYHNRYLRGPGVWRRRRTAPLVAFLGAFHHDLVGALKVIGPRPRSSARGRVDAIGAVRHAQRLRGLSPVRILDALAWGLGRGTLRAVPEDRLD